MSNTSENAVHLKRLLPPGAQRQIAEKTGYSKQLVSLALKQLNPAHPVVQEAVRMVKESGTLETQKSLDELLSVPEATAETGPD